TTPVTITFEAGDVTKTVDLTVTGLSYKLEGLEVDDGEDARNTRNVPISKARNVSVRNVSKLKSTREGEEGEDDPITLTLTGLGTLTTLTELVVPDELHGIPVTAIADRAFKNNKILTSVTMGKNIETIGESAFEGNTKLKDIYIKNQEIADITTNDSHLFTEAETVYVKQGIIPSSTSYIIEKFYNKDPASAGYVPYLKAIAKFKQIGAPYEFTIFLSEEGKVYSWGKGDLGELGHGVIESNKNPRVIEKTSTGSSLPPIQFISAGRNHSLALTEDGKIYAWGSNGNKQIGLDTSDNVLVPTLITKTSNPSVSLPRIKTVVAAYKHSFAITTDGQLYAWGNTDKGVLGNGQTSGYLHTPTLIPLNLNGEKIMSIATGYMHTIALTEGGNVYTWGDNSSGQIGNNTSGDTAVTSPYRIASLTNVKAVAAGSMHSLALTNDGSVYVWGANGNGQIGVTGTHHVPQKVLDSVKTIGAGVHNTFAITTNDTLYAWGQNASGEVGNDNSPTNATTPASVLNNIKSIGTGYHTVFAFAEDGILYSWGYNAHGQIPNITATPISKPTPVFIYK
ncbi:MAG: leucine-rich repeat protein, partial [Treponemataceae bacterium]